jgi:phenylalanine-4-hydroxylase
MSIASLKNSSKKIDLSKMKCFDKFDDYMEKLGARQDRIDAYEDI